MSSCSVSLFDLFVAVPNAEGNKDAKVGGGGLGREVSLLDSAILWGGNGLVSSVCCFVSSSSLSCNLVSLTGPVRWGGG